MVMGNWRCGQAYFEQVSGECVFGMEFDNSQRGFEILCLSGLADTRCFKNFHYNSHLVDFRQHMGFCRGSTHLAKCDWQYRPGLAAPFRHPHLARYA
eukprot:c27332_g1_i1 orf=204-494(+)